MTKQEEKQQEQEEEQKDEQGGVEEREGYGERREDVASMPTPPEPCRRQGNSLKQRKGVQRTEKAASTAAEEREEEWEEEQEERQHET